MYKWIARNHEGSSNVINDRTKWIYIYNGLLHCPTKLPDLSSITTQPPSRPCSGNSHLLIGLQWIICKGRRSTTTTWEGRSLGGVGGRKEPAASTTAGACSWWGSITRWGVIPRIMAGSGLMERAECGRHQHLWVFERGKIVFHHYRISHRSASLMFCVEWESARIGGAKISVKIFDCNHLCAGVLVLDKDPLGLKVLGRYV